MTVLIIAEKNSVAVDIAGALGMSKAGGYYEGGGYVCIGAVGHLCQLLPKQDVSKWGELGQLPLIVNEWHSVVNESTKDKFESIKALALRKDVDCLINACDAGREGELIFKLIVEAIGVRKQLKRAWLQSMTADGIKEAFANLREDDRRMEASARCRSIADFLVGINGTRAVTQLKRHIAGSNDICQVGRVRTPTLGIVYDREYEIATFKPTKFWRSIAKFISNKSPIEFEAELVEAAPWEGKTLEISQALAASCASPADAVVVAASDKTTPTKRNPPFLYDLTGLQRKMNRTFGMSAADTLETVQSLYEKHKVLSYPRTDSKRLPEDYHRKAMDAFKYLSVSKLVPDYLKRGFATLDHDAESVVMRPGKRVFDDKGITDHFAIIPIGGESVTGAALSAVEKQVFEAVCLVFCQAFYPPALIDKTVRTIELANKAQFEVEGKVTTDQGWLAVAGDTEKEKDKKADEGDVSLPPIDGAGSVRFLGLRSIESSTRAPSFFTEDTLLGAMEHAGRYVDDEELAGALSDRGLGTSATRASIIESLLANKTPNGATKTPDLGRAEKFLRITQKGASVIRELRSFGAESLCSPELTGEWELRLRMIERGEIAESEFTGDIQRFCAELVKPLQQKAEYTPKFLVPPVKGVCPECEKPDCIRPSKYSYVCDCGNFSVSMNIAGRAITVADVEELLSNGITKVLKGFTSSKTNKPFEAALNLVVDEQEKTIVKFSFPEAEAPVHFCTSCGKGLTLRSGKKNKKSYKFWGCLGYKDGCKVTYEDVKGKPKFNN